MSTPSPVFSATTCPSEMASNHTQYKSVTDHFQQSCFLGWLATKIGVGSSHHAFAVGHHLLNVLFRSCKHTNQLAVLGHCWCAENWTGHEFATSIAFAFMAVVSGWTVEPSTISLPLTLPSSIFLRSLIAFLDEVLVHALIDRSVIVRHDDGTGNVLCPCCLSQSMPIEGPFSVFWVLLRCFSPGDGRCRKNL
jgi:hypothetical protein